MRFIMESKSFTAEQDEKLIDLVREHRVLYDLHHCKYKDSIVRENVWKEIAASLNKGAEDCKTRWRTIRDSYRKSNKKLKTGSKTGSPAFSKSKYNTESLKFLDETYKERASKSSININEIIENNQETQEMVDDCPSEECNQFQEEESAQESTNWPSEQTSSSELLNSSIKKRKITVKEKMLDEIRKGREERGKILKDLLENRGQDRSQHPIDIFFQSMSETVKQFPPHLIAETRLKVCQVVSQMELRSLMEHQNQTNPNHQQCYQHVDIGSGFPVSVIDPTQICESTGSNSLIHSTDSCNSSGNDANVEESDFVRLI
ncbi:transcription factor Adf-1-like [Bacillus rossius redtenbacheri]|uniref:transcription factor Adf-1-like n=1 Tax=Bacillus rossius redtenbacheri TaxID=93214 RepID=UPI002FDD51F5